jgi:hypothetical protein
MTSAAAGAPDKVNSITGADVALGAFEATQRRLTAERLPVLPVPAARIETHLRISSAASASPGPSVSTASTTRFAAISRLLQSSTCAAARNRAHHIR